MNNIPSIDDIKIALPEIKSLEFVDSGGFKAVYKGDISGKKEAIKMIYLPSENDENDSRNEIINRVKREFETLKKCKTNCIVKLGIIELKTIKVQNYDYLIYSEEFIDGESLKEKIKKNYKPDFNELKILTKCLMQALLDLNYIKLIHRDIKPGNILNLCLTDC